MLIQSGIHNNTWEWKTSTPMYYCERKRKVKRGRPGTETTFHWPLKLVWHTNHHPQSTSTELSGGLWCQSCSTETGREAWQLKTARHVSGDTVCMNCACSILFLYENHYWLSVAIVLLFSHTEWRTYWTTFLLWVYSSSNIFVVTRSWCNQIEKNLSLCMKEVPFVMFSLKFGLSTASFSC